MDIEVLKQKYQGKQKLDRPINFRLAREDTDQPKIIWRKRKTGEEVPEGTPGAIGYRRFWAMISTETRDDHGTIIDRNGVVLAFMGWMDRGGGNVRFMHEMNPTGRIFDDDWELREDGIYAGFSVPISETRTLEKIDADLIRFVSIGFNIDWNAEDPIEWVDENTIRIKRIVIIEISLGDYGSTPGTHIQEERAAGGSSDSGFLKKLYNAVTKLTAVLTRNASGATPQPLLDFQEEDEDMTPEQMKELSASIVQGITGALKPSLDRLASAGGTPPNQEPEPKPSGGVSADDLKKIITESLKAELAPIQERLSAVESGLNTDEALSNMTVGDLQKSIEQYEQAVQKRLADSQGADPSPDEQLSFIRRKDGGSMSLADLGGGE